ncbi:MAG: isoprenylcysteine carboxylmethyltransferase family protein [Terracidiphilus sp.]|jgi:protein-S-isoprenylcysteine O-methyltransferase Ste14
MRTKSTITPLLFLPGGAYVVGMPVLLLWLSSDWRWVQGWIFYASFAILFGACMLWLYLRDPALLAERIRRPGTGGQSRSDLAILLGIKVGTIAWLVLPALDRRFGWTPRLAPWIETCGSILLGVGYVFFFRSITGNTFLSQLVRIQSDRGQHVVSTGVYGFVRHPMYLGASLMFVGGSLLLGSVPGLITGLGLVLLLAVRILGEEKLLLNGLEGYRAYREKVRYRLIPGVW